MGIEIEYSIRTHRGLRRSANQDNFVIGRFHPDADGSGFTAPSDGKLRPPRLFGVFDGMGGEAYGETAAFLAAEEAALFRPGRDPEKELDALCRRANRRITDHAEKHCVDSMGTTAAMALFLKKTAVVCNVGDSRIYRFRGGLFEQLSRDHVSLVRYGRKPALSQNLGMPEELAVIEPSVASYELADGDLFLICSDGLTDMVSDGRIRRILSEERFVNAADRLLEEALLNGGKDNITILLIGVKRRGLFG